VHRDIKPDNLHLDAEGRLRMLDLGVAASDGQDDGGDLRRDQQPGHARATWRRSFSPAGVATANEASDLYAVGVTLYHLLTRKYPYGEIEPFQTPRFGDPMPPTRYRPDIPGLARSRHAQSRRPRARRPLRDRRGISARAGARRPASAARGATHSAAATRPAAGPLLAVASLVVNLLLVFLLFAH
jgi:serine/threonine protein kinase